MEKNRDLTTMKLSGKKIHFTTKHGIFDSLTGDTYTRNEELQFKDEFDALKYFMYIKNKVTENKVEECMKPSSEGYLTFRGSKNYIYGLDFGKDKI